MLVEEVSTGFHLFPVELDAKLNVSDRSLSVELELVQPLLAVSVDPFVKFLEH